MPGDDERDQPPIVGELCPFCSLAPGKTVLVNEAALALRDGYPVTPGHTLIVPKRHVAGWFEASPEEQRAMADLLKQVKGELDAELSPDGYNIGFNLGRAAGQTVGHLHVHVIPRYAGDVDDPTGGIRLVIPERGNYHTDGRVPRARGDRPPWRGDGETP